MDSINIRYIPAREIVSGDVIMFDDGSEAEVIWAALGDEKEHGLVTLNAKIALPWLISVRTVEKPVVTHPAQEFKVRRATISSPHLYAVTSPAPA